MKKLKKLFKLLLSLTFILGFFSCSSGPKNKSINDDSEVDRKFVQKLDSVEVGEPGESHFAIGKKGHLLANSSLIKVSFPDRKKRQGGFKVLLQLDLKKDFKKKEIIRKNFNSDQIPFAFDLNLNDILKRKDVKSVFVKVQVYEEDKTKFKGSLEVQSPVLKSYLINIMPIKY